MVNPCRYGVIGTGCDFKMGPYLGPRRVSFIKCVCLVGSGSGG